MPTISNIDFNFFNSLSHGTNPKSILNKDNLKKKFHLPLRKNTKVRLKELAELYNISESELLEKLINKEYEEYKDYK